MSHGPLRTSSAFLYQRVRSWIFLAQDYTEYIRWHEAMPSQLEIKIKEELDQIAHELRKPFLDLIIELGAKFNSPAWWASRISERNTLVSPLFIAAIKVFLIKRGSIFRNTMRYCRRLGTFRVVGA